MARVCTHKRISCARRASPVSNLAGPSRRDSIMRDEARTIDETAGVLKGPSARVYAVHVGSIALPDDRTVARYYRAGAPCRRTVSTRFQRGAMITVPIHKDVITSRTRLFAVLGTGAAMALMPMSTVDVPTISRRLRR